ncbi:hypothetical protein [Lentilactobacillus sp. Marseille-Q4993]|uniref:hypothetical protein n=1 Tax=Lentilactobacillus sp. Marseille-Q4993 TaxID=3039492 RepID=UPI0024BC479C|nr:hypothetical protein [Lentilactobacillus sp. Marseille-Q4993]
MKKRYIGASAAFLLALSAGAVLTDQTSVSAEAAVTKQAPTANSSESFTFSLVNGMPVSFEKNIIVDVMDGGQVVTTKTIKSTESEYPDANNSGFTLSEKDGLKSGHNYSFRLYDGKQEWKVLDSSFTFGKDKAKSFEVDAQALQQGTKTFKIVDSKTGKPVSGAVVTAVQNIDNPVNIDKQSDQNGIVQFLTSDKNFNRDVIYSLDVKGYEIKDGMPNWNLIGGEDGKDVTTVKVAAEKPVVADKSEDFTFSLLNGMPVSYDKDITAKVLDGDKVVATKVIKSTKEEYPSAKNSGFTLSTNDGLQDGKKYSVKLYDGKQEWKVLDSSFTFGKDKAKSFEVDAQALQQGTKTFKIVDSKTGKPVSGAVVTAVQNIDNPVNIDKQSDQNGIVQFLTSDKNFNRNVIYSLDVKGYEIKDGMPNWNLIGGEDGKDVTTVKVATKEVTPAKDQEVTSSTPAGSVIQPSSSSVSGTNDANSASVPSSSSQQPVKVKKTGVDLISIKAVHKAKPVKVSGKHRFYKNTMLSKWVKTSTKKQFRVTAKVTVSKNGKKLSYYKLVDSHKHVYYVWNGFVK